MFFREKTTLQYCTHHAPFYPRELLAGVLQPRIIFSLFLARTQPSFDFSHPDDCFFVLFYAVDSSLKQDASLCRSQLVFCFYPCASRLDVTVIPSYVSTVFFGCCPVSYILCPVAFAVTFSTQWSRDKVQESCGCTHSRAFPLGA